jgi:hypothetical protein
MEIDAIERLMSEQGMFERYSPKTTPASALQRPGGR